jgi:hypothetical protein
LSSIPSEFQGSPAFALVLSQGWEYRTATSSNIEIEACPYCKHSNYHFRMEIHGAGDADQNRDGLHMCHHCGKGGNLFSLKDKLKLVNPAMESTSSYGGSKGESSKMEEMPDTDAMHEALLADEPAMDYLLNGRGFSQEIVEQMKLGLTKRYFRETGEVRALVYPYLVNGQAVFLHFRTLPTMPLEKNKVEKAFSSLKGWDVPIYNGEILREGLKEVFFVEGEANCIAAIDHGVTDICGVPGANFKKADWIDTLDRIGVEKVYICYDKDKVGQKAAQTLAARIGIEKCWKIVLPDFDVVTDEGKHRKGKDLNEWFVSGGGTAEALQKLKEDARLFDVDGVASSHDSVQEFYEDLLGNGVEPKYQTAWPTLNKVLGIDEGDVIDILAPEKVGKTTFGLNIMEHMVSAYGEDGVIICLEMTRARMARKWICHVTGIEDNIPKSSEEATFLKDQFMDAIPKVQAMAGERKGTLYFCYPKYSTKEEIYDLMKDCIRRYGVKWIMIDNIQRLADTTSSAKGTNRTEHLSQISKVTSQIAKDYNIQMIRILQPHRIMVGKMVTTDNVDGSSQIAKDCDCMVTLHRNRKAELTQEQFDQLQHIESDGAFETGMVVTAGLTRYSQGGTTTLEYDGARSTVLERNETIKSKIKDSHKVEDQGSKIAALKAATAPALAQPPIAPGKAPEAAVTPVAPQSAVSAEDGGEITV